MASERVRPKEIVSKLQQVEDDEGERLNVKIQH